MSGWKRSDIQEATEACKEVHISQATRDKLHNPEVGLKRITGLDIEVSIKLKPEQWTKILEQVYSIFASILLSSYAIQ